MEPKKYVFDAQWRKIEVPTSPKEGSQRRVLRRAAVAVAGASAAGSCYLYFEYVHKPRAELEAQRVLEELGGRQRQQQKRRG